MRSSALLGVVAPGNALAILDASQSAARAPTPKRLADAIAAAGGAVRQFKAPKEGALAGWIEGEARERGLALAPGTAKGLAERVGGFVREGDTERAYQTRLASMELDKLALYRGAEPIRPDDVEALVAEAVPGSVWAFTDAIGERRVERALGWLDRLFDSTPEPVLLAVLASSDPGADRDRRPGRRRANGCPRSVARWGSPASSGWRSSATRRSCGPRPSSSRRSTGWSSSMRW